MSAGAGPHSFVLLSHLVYGSFSNVLAGKSAGQMESLSTRAKAEPGSVFWTEKFTTSHEVPEGFILQTQLQLCKARKTDVLIFGDCAFSQYFDMFEKKIP